MLSVYRNMFRIRDLRTKVLYTLFIFAIYRLGAAVPVPGIDIDQVQRFADEAGSSGIVGLLNLFSGGALETFSVFSLGIMPYITSSIIMQLLAVVIPRLQRLQDEGEAGRKAITQWTRYITVVLALLQSTGLTFLFHQGILTGGIDLIPNYTPGRVLIIVITLTAGTAFIMWLGELISQRGIGNGMSLIIFVSIVSQIPSQFVTLSTSTDGYANIRFWLVVAMFLVMTAGIIFVDQGQRRIPIQFSKRVRGRRVMGGQSTYIPLKVNTAGVIPVIFASSVLYFPALIATSIPAEGFFAPVRRFIDSNLVSAQTYWYVVMFGLLIIFFTYFYTAIQFDPARQSDMIQRQGGFVPGIRPGSQTTRYLEHILSRITLPGSLFLASVAVLPSLVAIWFNLQLGFSGISILIVVGVALETMKQIESQLMMRNYEGFL
ncbi:MAG: preprotein translocase subunit SecY, partial [Acidimicrobiia bacterium]